MKTKLFQSQDREGFLVNINIDYIVSIHQKHVDMGQSMKKLLTWLEFNYYDTFNDIEAFDVHVDEYEEGYQILFVGDNGSFELNEVEVETIK